MVTVTCHRVVSSTAALNELVLLYFIYFIKELYLHYLPNILVYLTFLLCFLLLALFVFHSLVLRLRPLPIRKYLKTSLDRS